MGGSKSKLYMTLDEQDCAAADAEGLKSAMAGLGTNEADLITDLAFKNDRHLSLVKKIFNEKFGKQGNLQKWIEDDTSGDFKDLLIAMAADEPEVIADALHKAMKGIGTDDDLLMYTLSTRSPIQLERAKDVFQRKYPGENLEKWIMDDTSGDYMKILVALADKNLYYCKVLNKAITSGDENELISILVSLKHHDEIKRIVSNFSDPIGYASDLISELENEFSNPTLREIAVSYERLYGVPLLNAIRKETSGKFEKLIMGLLEDHSLRDAEYVRKACSGAGTDEDRLIQIFVTRGEKDRENLSRAYMGAYGKSLTDEIIAETSDRFKDTLLNLAKPKGVVLAEALHKAIHGMGTDERAVITLLVHRSRKELRDMAVAYKNLYQKDVIQAVADDTSGWFRRALTFLLKEATAPKRRMFISKRLLIAASEV